jgi:hypothetical protein
MRSIKTLSLAPALILGVSLTGCSDLLSEMDKLSLAQAAEAKPVPVAKQEPQHPDLPPNLVACATSKPKGATGSADAKVLALQKQADASRACALALAGWYRKLQEANRKADPPKT